VPRRRMRRPHWDAAVDSPLRLRELIPFRCEPRAPAQSVECRVIISPSIATSEPYEPPRCDERDDQREGKHKEITKWAFFASSFALFAASRFALAFGRGFQTGNVLSVQKARGCRNRNAHRRVLAPNVRRCWSSHVTFIDASTRYALPARAVKRRVSWA